MKKHHFFYNYTANTANKAGVYNKFNCGIMTVEFDNADLTDHFLEKLKAIAKKDYPDATINITAFNRV